MSLLNKGDKIAIICPSACIEAESLQKGVSWLEAQGFEVVLMPHVYDQFAYMAGTDKDRADDFNAAMKDPTIKAVFCARGGGGSTRMLPYVDWAIVRQNPKPIFGLSDNTALQNAAFALAENVSYSGFLPIYDFKNGVLDRQIEESMQQIFAGKKLAYTGGEKLVGGKSRGVLIGGNLRTLNYLCGTKYFPDLRGKILFLEDVGEKTYCIDLMLNQLRQQDGFNEIRGFIFGQFSHCKVSDEEDGTLEETLARFAQNLDVPVLYNFPYGHIPSRYVLPIGLEMLLDADNCLLKIAD